MDNCEFKFWESACSLYNGCAFYANGELLASCVLEKMTSQDIEQLHCFNLVSIYSKNLIIQKKIIKYNYKEKCYFVQLLKEMKKKIQFSDLYQLMTLIKNYFVQQVIMVKGIAWVIILKPMYYSFRILNKYLAGHLCLIFSTSTLVCWMFLEQWKYHVFVYTWRDF